MCVCVWLKCDNSQKQDRNNIAGKAIETIGCISYSIMLERLELIDTNKKSKPEEKKKHERKRMSERNKKGERKWKLICTFLGALNRSKYNTKTHTHAHIIHGTSYIWNEVG